MYTVTDKAEIMSVVYELAIIHNVEAARKAAVSILNTLDEYDKRGNK